MVMKKTMITNATKASAMQQVSPSASPGRRRALGVRIAHSPRTGATIAGSRSISNAANRANR